MNMVFILMNRKESSLLGRLIMIERSQNVGKIKVKEGGSGKIIMRKIGIVAASLLIGLSTLTGCTKCIKKTTEPVKVKIVNEYYNPEQIKVAGYSGGRPIIKNEPAEYEITVEYDGVDYSFHSESVYRKYHGRVGEMIQGTLVTREYDDGTSKSRIVSIGGQNYGF